MALLYFSESPGSRAENASSSPWLSPELPQGTCCVCAMLTDQSLLFQQPRPTDLETLSPIATGWGGTSAITLGLTTTISVQAVGAVRKSFNFTNFGLQAEAKEGHTGRKSGKGQKTNTGSPKILKKNSEKEAIKTQVKGQ